MGKQRLLLRRPRPDVRHIALETGTIALGERHRAVKIGIVPEVYQARARDTQLLPHVSYPERFRREDPVIFGKGLRNVRTMREERHVRIKTVGLDAECTKTPERVRTHEATFENQQHVRRKLLGTTDERSIELTGGSRPQ